MASDLRDTGDIDVVAELKEGVRRRASRAGNRQSLPKTQMLRGGKQGGSSRLTLRSGIKAGLDKNSTPFGKDEATVQLLAKRLFSPLVKEHPPPRRDQFGPLITKFCFKILRALLPVSAFLLTLLVTTMNLDSDFGIRHLADRIE